MNNTLLSHNAFLDKYLRKAIDEDGGYGYQCIDLAKLYAREVYGITLGSFGGTARTGWLNTKKTFDLKKWDRIPYKVGLEPQRGDIIFYDKPGLTGHVAVCDSANKLNITVVEQNGFSGNGSGKGFDSIMLETKRDYDSILGWYRLR